MSSEDAHSAGLSFVKPPRRRKFTPPSGTGFDVTAENDSSLGSSDLEIKTTEHHWVIELKYLPQGQGTADAFLSDAVEQMKDRRYGASAKVPLLRVAAVFSAESRAFVAWKVIV